MGKQNNMLRSPVTQSDLTYELPALTEKASALCALNIIFFVSQNAESQNVTQSGEILAHEIPIRKLWYR